MFFFSYALSQESPLHLHLNAPDFIILFQLYSEGFVYILFIQHFTHKISENVFFPGYLEW